MLLRDLRRIARGLVTTARVALRDPEPAPGLAVLEGAAIARARGATCYRVRIHNPGPHARSLDVVVWGERSDAETPAFEVGWSEALDAGAAVDRWVVTNWMGAARVADTPPAAAPILFGDASNDAAVRWTIEAHVASSPDRLHIEGSLVA
jgi:hypothetical protein